MAVASDMTQKDWSVASVGDTATVARWLLARLTSLTSQEQATVLALDGELGAGKTTFTQQLALALGVAEPVTSPTFVIIKTYPTNQTKSLSQTSKPSANQPLSPTPWTQLVHIDAYRLESPAELERLNFSQLLADRQNLICIEWAKRVRSLLPPITHHLHFSITENRRLLTYHYGQAT